MSWTINNTPVEDLGVTVSGWTENTLNASTLTLETEVDNHAVAAVFGAGDQVTLRNDGAQVFTGKVRRVPRSADAAQETIIYTVDDAWRELDGIVYQEPQDYVQDIPGDDLDVDGDKTLVPVVRMTGNIVFDNEESLGQRISKVLNYASGINGCDINVGTIDAGIGWFRSAYKDRTCGELIREMMRLMPEYVCWLDNRTPTATMHMKPRVSMSAESYNIAAGTAILSHQIEELDAELTPSVCIRYEKPISIDGDEHIEVVEDVYPPGADGMSVGALVESVALSGATHQNEYAPITTRDIPQDNASDEDIKEWWVDQIAALAVIGEKHGLSNLLGLIKIPGEDVAAENVIKHALTLVNTPQSPDPINPNARVIAAGNSVGHFPRQIIAGNLPKWAEKRYSQIRAVCTLAVKKSAVAAIENDQLKKQIEEIFALPKSFGGSEYLTTTATAQVTGTNAKTRNYKRVMTYDVGEPRPVGIAEAMYAQLNEVRHAGSITLVGAAPDAAPRPGKSLNITGGLSSWAAMKESIQSVRYDVASGTTDVTFGPPEQIGAADMIDRLRALRRNSYSHIQKPTEEMIEGTGGTVASATSNFNITSGGGGGTSLGCLELTGSAQPYHTPVTGSEGAGVARVYVTFGHVSNMIPDNVSSHFDLSQGDYLYLVVSISNSSGSYVATSVTLEQSSELKNSSEKTGDSISKLNYILGKSLDEGSFVKMNSSNKGVTSVMTNLAFTESGVESEISCFLT